jgi:Protein CHLORORESPIRATORY REDUCTION 7
MYDEQMYVWLEPGQPEKFLTTIELLEQLKEILCQRQHDLPRDLKHIPSIEAQAQRLLDTACDLDVGPDQYLQWYAVRLEK